MKPLFKPNIDRRGRLIRAVLGMSFLVAAGWMARLSEVGAVMLGISGLFVLLEAARGWCVARACGVKTKF